MASLLLLPPHTHTHPPLHYCGSIPCAPSPTLLRLHALHTLPCTTLACSLACPFPCPGAWPLPPHPSINQGPVDHLTSPHFTSLHLTLPHLTSPGCHPYLPLPPPPPPGSPPTCLQVCGPPGCHPHLHLDHVALVRYCKVTGRGAGGGGQGGGRKDWQPQVGGMAKSQVGGRGGGGPRVLVLVKGRARGGKEGRTATGRGAGGGMAKPQVGGQVRGRAA